MEFSIIYVLHLQAIVQVINSSTKIKVDQNHVQTVIPLVSSTIRIVNGAYRGEYATLEQVDKEKGTCEVTLMTVSIVIVCVDFILLSK